MSEYKRFTRSVKHDKRQKQKRKILFFGSLAVLFLIIFVSLILFGNKGNPKETEVASHTNKTEEHDENSQEEETPNKSETNEDKELQDSTLVPVDEDEEEQEVNIEEIDSDNANVIKAYKGDWKPVGTEQTGEHTIVYDDGSADRVEIKRAVAMVTDISEDSMIEHWIGRGGDQEVIATVSEPSVEKYYRVYLQWIDTEGWQPTMVEELNHFEK